MGENEEPSGQVPLSDASPEPRPPRGLPAPVDLAPFPDHPDSYRRLAHWLKDPLVARFYPEDTDPDRLRAKYGPRTHPGSRVRPWFILLEAKPVGYCQCYRLTHADIAAYGLTAKRRWGGFDLFVGEPAARGRGVGSATIARLLEELRALAVDAAAIDTRADNVRAVQIYAAHGFTAVRRLVSWEHGVDHILLTRQL
jgi:ribosomal protein S18 acetylase RimI-like enzyme